MALHLGLDLGTASIGWSLASYTSQGKFENFIRSGVRIIPMGKHKGDFEAGRTITKNAERRQKRSARRLRQRYLLRRNNLLKVFKVLEISQEDLQIADTSGAAEYYRNRYLGLTQKLDLLSFAQIIYRMNQRRGYKSSRKENLDEISAQSIIREFSIVSKEKTGFNNKKRGDEYRLHLSNGKSGLTYDRALISFPENKLTEIQLNYNGKVDSEPSLSKPNPDEWQGRLDLMQFELNKTGLTPGAYFYHKVKENPHYRVRERLVLREAYQKEFDLLWDAQEKYHPSLSNTPIYHQILQDILPENTPNLEHWEGKTLKEFVRDYIVFYQRPLKPKRSSIGDCPLESVMLKYEENGKIKTVHKARKVIPVSHPLYQEFRIWSAINNIKIEDDKGISRFLKQEQKATLFEYLQREEKVNQRAVRKILPEINKSLKLNMPEDLKGNTTLIKLAKAAKSAGISLNKVIPQQENLDQLWHLLYSIDDKKIVKNSLQRNFNLTAEQAKHFNKVTFKVDRGAYSAVAIRKLLPLMRAGEYFEKQNISRYALKRISQWQEANPDDEALMTIASNYGLDFYDVNTFQGLPVYLALTTQYGKYQAQEQKEKLQSPKEIQLVKRHSLRNPLVEQILNEMLQMVGDIWQKYGRPDNIRIELSRDLKQSATERQEKTKAISRNTKENETIRKKLREEFGIDSPTRKDILKYKLWYNQQCEQCIYSGRNIQKSDLFSGVTDIDHIIPQQRYYDDSQSNKVLCFSTENKAKDNRTAYEYMQGKGTAAFNAFVTRIKSMQLGGRKKSLLLAEEVPTDFTQRQLQETRYISRKAVELLEPIAANRVAVTSGNITDYLKNKWDLNEAFKEVQVNRFQELDDLYLQKIEELEAKEKIKKSDTDLIDELKTILAIPAVEYAKRKNGHNYLKLRDWNKRIDHRHHALDAMCCVLTTQGMIQRLANLNKNYKAQYKLSEKKKARYFPLPHPKIKAMVKEQLENIIVAHKSTNRLLTRNTNRTKKRNPKTGKLTTQLQVKDNYSVRGQLHDEQPFGKIRLPAEKPIDIKKVFSQIDNIVHPYLKQQIAERLAEYQQDIEAAIKSLKKNPIQDREGITVKKIQIFEDKYVKNRTLSPLLTLKMVKEIPDLKVKNLLLEHLSKFGNAPKKAFTAEAIEALNQSLENSIFSVRSAKNADLMQLKKKNDPNEKLYVDPGNNFAFLIYEDMEIGERKYEVLSFFDVIMLKSKLGKLDLEKPGYHLQMLKKGDLVYLPEDGEIIDTNTFKRPYKELSSHIYKVVKFTKSGDRLYCIKHNIAQSLYSELGSENYTTCAPTTTETPKRSFKEAVVKIRINRLGEVTPI